MDARARRKFRLESLLHDPAGRHKIVSLYFATLMLEGEAKRVPLNVPLRDMIHQILDIEYPRNDSQMAG